MKKAYRNLGVTFIPLMIILVIVSLFVLISNDSILRATSTNVVSDTVLKISNTNGLCTVNEHMADKDEYVVAGSVTTTGTFTPGKSYKGYSFLSKGGHTDVTGACIVGTLGLPANASDTLEFTVPEGNKNFTATLSAGTTFYYRFHIAK